MSDNEELTLAKETWRLFRIISEFVEGFETMSEISKAVTVFGSARTKEDDPIYKEAVECGRKLVESDASISSTYSSIAL